MIKVHDKIYVGQARMVKLLNPNDYSFLGVSSKYHYELLGWTRGFKYQDDPNYIVYEEENRMSVNWVDAQAKFYNWQGKGVETFIRVLDFIGKQTKPILIFCDKGQSRSPSVALLYLSKRLKVIPDESFDKAKEKFLLLYPYYSPGGIADFIRERWEVIT